MTGDACAVLEQPRNPSLSLQAAFGATVRLIVQPLFAGQMIVATVARDFSLGGAETGLTAAASLHGYAVGLVCLVPLADIIETRRFMIRLLAAEAVALLICATAQSFVVLLAAAFAAGTASCAIQVLIPLIATVTPDARRGWVVGNVVSGLMLGILLSRLLPAFISGSWGWRPFYAFAACATAVAIGIINTTAPEHRPRSRESWLRFMIRDRLPLIRFLRFDLGGPTPDENTIWLFGTN
ncbi:MFS transporter [Acidiphilium cryptum]|uniref:Arabinose efflux permease-like protein n=1 Tax=Acidiphilium cryptum (strain JF-5) TaxID=349163 RepID=A5FTV0_ACICJ|nr:MFS transporter [Acidiphilium cryptum]ABQ29032.1 Arabinose efflux permease-like protein [Acidiphilium cryptum JF-5]